MTGQRTVQSRGGAAKARPALEPLSLSIVLPCRNEEANVERVAREALKVGRRLARHLQVVIVNDGSTDRTGAIADELARAHPEVRVVHHETGRGYGGALRGGFGAATGEWVFYTDGDGQFEMGQLEGVLPLLREHDVVAGYRIKREDPSHRRLFGWAWSRVVWVVLGLRVRDIDCAFKVLPCWFVQSAPLRASGAMISAELLAHAKRQGLRLAQVGVHHRARTGGRATGGNWRVIAKAMRELVGLRRELRAGPPRSGGPLRNKEQGPGC
ncbi:MAG: glycosyltransferase family 2 protein [Phycisphaerales bacterium]|nr:glycosyltransferase family 2 protein [Phycisphaerales bacterium]